MLQLDRSDIDDYVWYAHGYYVYESLAVRSACFMVSHCRLEMEFRRRRDSATPQ